MEITGGVKKDKTKVHFFMNSNVSAGLVLCNNTLSNNCYLVSFMTKTDSAFVQSTL
jgi:hypothetical protein